MRFLLDSTVLIDHLNGIDAAEVFLRTHAADSCLSVVTINEVLAGSQPEAVRGHELLLDLVTRNHRHFKPDRHAFVTVPYRL